MNEIEGKVIEHIAESLALEPEEVELESRLFSELGVSSLDFLDITFALEMEFDIEIRDEEFDMLTQFDTALDGETEEGFFTPEAIEMISRWIPEVKKIPDQDKISRGRVFELITVESVVKLVERKVSP